MRPPRAREVSANRALEAFDRRCGSFSELLDVEDEPSHEEQASASERDESDESDARDFDVRRVDGWT